MKIKLNDEVLVIAGKDRGKKGKILRVFEKTGRVVVEKINMRTRHIKKTASRPGEIIHYEGPLNASNVMVLDPKTGKPTRIGYKIENGKKVRIAKVSGEVLEAKVPKKSKQTRA